MIPLLLLLLPGVSARGEKRIPSTVRLPPPRRTSDAPLGSVPCPCSSSALCSPVSGIPDREIFGFGSGGWNVTGEFDFDTLTTVAWGEGGGEFVCKAHANNVRVIGATTPPLSGNQTEIDDYIADTIQSVQENFYDGVTFDYESPVTGYDDPLNAIYVDVIDQTTKALKAVNPNYQTSVCAAWSPLGIDGRYYDYKSLAAVSDFLYVMCYDTRSQVFYQCVASANAPISICQKGINDFLQLGVKPDKLVLGVPWYGYSYPCANSDMTLESKLCEIPQEPFRGVNCSDAAGSEVQFSTAMDYIKTNNSDTAHVGPVWRDEYLNVQYFNYINDGEDTIHQFWFDDDVSLSPIYMWVKEMELRGTGPFTFSQAGSGEDSKKMWEALKLAL